MFSDKYKFDKLWHKERLAIKLNYQVKIGEFLCRHIDGQAFHQGPWACPLNTDNGETEVDSDYPHHTEFLEYGI